MILSPFQLFAAKSRFFSLFVYKVDLIAPDRSHRFCDENTDPSEHFMDQWSLYTLLVGSGSHFRMKTIPPYRYSPANSQRHFETILFTEKMKSGQTLSVELSVGRVIIENILIFDGSLFIGVGHFPRRPYDG